MNRKIFIALLLCGNNVFSNEAFGLPERIQNLDEPQTLKNEEVIILPTPSAPPAPVNPENNDEQLEERFKPKRRSSAPTTAQETKKARLGSKFRKRVKAATEGITGFKNKVIKYFEKDKKSAKNPVKTTSTSIAPTPGQAAFEERITQETSRPSSRRTSAASTEIVGKVAQANEKPLMIEDRRRSIASSRRRSNETIPAINSSAAAAVIPALMLPSTSSVDPETIRTNLKKTQVKFDAYIENIQNLQTSLGATVSSLTSVGKDAIAAQSQYQGQATGKENIVYQNSIVKRAEKLNGLISNIKNMLTQITGLVQPQAVTKPANSIEDID